MLTIKERIQALEDRGIDATGWINDAMEGGEFANREEALDHLEMLLAQI